MNNLVRSNKWMFRKVKCSAYMKKINDGRFIDKTENGFPVYFYTDTSKKSETGIDVWREEVNEYCGNLEFLKTYYRRTVKEFIGIVVGIKMICISAWLYVDTAFDCNGNDIGQYVGKQENERKKCALVYYGCNKSRWVPLDEIEIIEEDRNEDLH